jgi:hypothetical protein
VKLDPLDAAFECLALTQALYPATLTTKPWGVSRAEEGCFLMDMNAYEFELLARDRLAELRAQAERAYRLKAARRASRPLWVALGHMLSLVQGDRGGKVPARRTSTPGVVRG